MLSNLFIGVAAFALMGIPIIVTIAFICGLTRANCELKRKLSWK